MPQIGSGHYSGFAHMAYCLKVTYTQQSENIYSYSENNCRSWAMSRKVFMKIKLLIKYYLRPVQCEEITLSDQFLICRNTGESDCFSWSFS